MNSFTHAFLVNDLKIVADLVHADFCKTYKNAQAKDQEYNNLYFVL